MLLVVVEKPFTPTHAEAEELIALAKERGRILTVYQSERARPLRLQARVVITGLDDTTDADLVLVSFRPPVGLRLPDRLAARPKRQPRTDRGVRDAFRPVPPCDSGGR